MPGGVKLHVEQDQAAVPEGVDGAQGERRHQGGEERAPQGFQREVITYLCESREQGWGILAKDNSNKQSH